MIARALSYCVHSVLATVARSSRRELANRTVAITSEKLEMIVLRRNIGPLGQSRSSLRSSTTRNGAALSFNPLLAISIGVAAAREYGGSRAYVQPHPSIRLHGPEALPGVLSDRRRANAGGFFPVAGEFSQDPGLPSSPPNPRLHFASRSSVSLATPFINSRYLPEAVVRVSLICVSVSARTITYGFPSRTLRPPSPPSSHPPRERTNERVSERTRFFSSFPITVRAYMLQRIARGRALSAIHTVRSFPLGNYTWTVLRE